MQGAREKTMAKLLPPVVALTILASCGREAPPAGGPVADPFAGLASGWNRIAAGGETLCSNGGAYEFWFRPGDPKRVSIYFEGGGACWRPELCALDRNPSYDPVVDSTDDPAARNGIFDFANAENPVAGYSALYLPYCTGDVHVGDTVAVYDVPAAAGKPAESVTLHHVGTVNTDAALDWLYRRVTDPTDVFVSGTSAGALGSAFHAYRIATHYAHARVVQLGDAAGGYRTPAIPGILRTWNTPSVVPDLPEYRDPSTMSFETFYEAGGAHARNLRMAQFNVDADETQLSFLKLVGVQGIPLLRLLDQNLADIRALTPGFRSYIAHGTAHGILWRPSLYTTEVDGVRLVDWIRDLVAGTDVADVTCKEACR
jgi:Pectinacetylesterase